MPYRAPRFRPGDHFGLVGPGRELILDAGAARLMTEAAAELERLGRVSARPPLAWAEDATGRRLGIDLPPECMAKLSGAGPGYSWTQQVFTPGTGWAALTGGLSGTGNAYEANGATGLAGKVVPLEFQPESRDWRFQNVRMGPCGWKFVVNNCDGTKTLAGSLVELRQSGALVDSCTTTGQVTAVTLLGGGSSYTAVPTVGFTGGGGSGATAAATMKLVSLVRTAGGTGYTDGSYTNGTFSGGGGSGGAFSYTVSGGVIQPTLTITNAGSGYTTPPTPVFNAGPGTGATATVKLSVQSVAVTAGGSGYTANPAVTFSPAGATATASASTFCRMTPPSGSYDVTITPPAGAGLDTYAATLSHSCSGGDQVTTVTMTIDGSHECLPACPCPTPPDTLTTTSTIANFNDTYIYMSPVEPGAVAQPNTWYGQNGSRPDGGGGILYNYVQCVSRFQLTQKATSLNPDPNSVGGVVYIWAGPGGSDTCIPLSLTQSNTGAHTVTLMG